VEDTKGGEAPSWSVRLGGPGFTNGYGEEGAGVAAAPDGSAIVAADFKGIVHFGDASLSSAGGSDVLVGKLDTAGRPRWSLRLGDEEDQIFSGVAVDPDGNLLLTGVFSGMLDAGGGPLEAQGIDIFLVKLDAEGRHVWSRRYGGAKSIQWARAVAADREGNVLLAGSLEGSVDFDGLTITHTGVFPFAIKMDPYGVPLWSVSFGGSVDQEIASIGADPDGNVLVAGTAERSEVQGIPLPGEGLMNVLAAAFDPEGALRWARLIGDERDQWVEDMAVASDGSMLLTGGFVGGLDLGGGIRLAAPGEDEVSAYVARLDPRGAAAQGLAFHDTRLAGVAVDAQGDVLVAGSEPDRAAAPDAAEEHDALALRLDGMTLEVRWAGRFGGAQDQRATAVAADPLGRALLGGVFAGAIEIGGQRLLSESGEDLFAAAVRPR
jgi:hypothetical protein